MENNAETTREIEMLRAAKAGDLHTLGQLLTHYRPYLMAIAKRVLGDRPPDEWSSVVQTGTVAALERWDQFRGQTPGELGGWLAAIVRNQALDRRHNRTAASLQECLPAKDSTPSSQVIGRERAARLMSAMHQLPKQHREIIQLRFFEGLTHKQVAARMDRSHDAVRCLLVRAIRQLRDVFGESL